MKTLALQKIFPLQGIEQDFLVGGNGDITCGWEVMLPEVFSLDLSGYNQLYESFLNAFLKLPVGVVVHVQNAYYRGAYDQQREANNFCLKENERVFLGRPVLHHVSRIFLSFTNKRLNRVTAEHNPVLKMWDYIAGQPFKDIDSTVAQARSHQDLFHSSLSAIEGVSICAMDNNSLRLALWDYWNVSFDAPSSWQPGMGLPPYAVEDGYLRVGGRFVGIVSMVNQGECVFNAKVPRDGHGDLVGEEVSISSGIRLMLGSTFPIALGLPVDHLVNTIFTIQDRERLYVDFFKRSVAEGILAGFGYDPSIRKVEALRDFKEAISNRDFTVCRAAMNIIITDTDLKTLEHTLQVTRSALDNINGCHAWIENHETLSLFTGSSPGYGRGNYRTFDTVIEHALCYIPMETHYLSDMTGNLFADRFGNPVIVDLWDSPHTENRNALVEGASGTGKSFWINGLIDEDLNRGSHVIILDVGHSYRDLCTFNKGLYLDSSDLSNFSFNIFLTRRDPQGQWVLGRDKKIFIHSVLLTMWRGREEATMEVQSILKDLVEKFYEHINGEGLFPGFKEFFTFIDVYESRHFSRGREKFFDFESLRTVFDTYATGEYSTLLSRRENKSLHNEPLIVFDIESLENDSFIFPVVGLIIMELVMDKIRQLPGERKRFIIDEGWKVLRGELSEFVEYLYRTFRKHEGSIMLATQDINDFDGVASAEAMLSNTDTLILMRRSARKNYDDLRRWLSLTDHQISLMEDMKRESGYREFLLKQGDHARIFRYEVSDKTRAVYSSRGKDKAEIHAYFKKYGSLSYAINQFVERKYRQGCEV